jgi:hypothetical protein
MDTQYFLPATARATMCDNHGDPKNIGKAVASLGVAMRRRPRCHCGDTHTFITFMRRITVTGCAMVPEEHGIYLDFLFFLSVSFFTH